MLAKRPSSLSYRMHLWSFIIWKEQEGGQHLSAGCLSLLLNHRENPSCRQERLSFHGSHTGQVTVWPRGEGPESVRSEQIGPYECQKHTASKPFPLLKKRTWGKGIFLHTLSTQKVVPGACTVAATTLYSSLTRILRLSSHLLRMQRAETLQATLSSAGPVSPDRTTSLRALRPDLPSRICESLVQISLSALLKISTAIIVS